MRVAIVHGAYGSPEENWIPWLKQELGGLGCRVIVPRFPTPKGQELNAWLQILNRAVPQMGPRDHLRRSQPWSGLDLKKTLAVERVN